MPILNTDSPHRNNCEIRTESSVAHLSGLPNVSSNNHVENNAEIAAATFQYLPLPVFEDYICLSNITLRQADVLSP